MDSFEEILQKKMQRARPHAPRPDWDRMAAQLDQKDRKGFLVYWQRALWAALILLLVAAGWGAHALFEGPSTEPVLASSQPTTEATTTLDLDTACLPLVPSAEPIAPTTQASPGTIATTAHSPTSSPPQQSASPALPAAVADASIAHKKPAAPLPVPPQKNMSSPQRDRIVRQVPLGDTPQIDTGPPSVGTLAAAVIPGDQQPQPAFAAVQGLSVADFAADIAAAPVDQGPWPRVPTADIPAPTVRKKTTDLPTRLGLGVSDGWRSRKWQVSTYLSATTGPLPEPSIYGSHPGLGVSLDRRLGRRWAIGLQAERVHWWLPARAQSFESVNAATGDQEFGLIDYWGQGNIAHVFGRFYTRPDRYRRWQPYLVGGLGIHQSRWRSLQVSSPYSTRDALRNAFDLSDNFSLSRDEPELALGLSSVAYGASTVRRLAQAYGGVGLQLRIWRRLSLSWESTLHTQWQMTLPALQDQSLAPVYPGQDEDLTADIPQAPNIPLYLTHRIGLRISF